MWYVCDVLYALLYVRVSCFVIVCINVVVNVMLSLLSVMSPPPALCNLSARTVVKLCTLGVFALEVIPELDDICMCVVDKQFELLEYF